MRSKRLGLLFAVLLGVAVASTLPSSNAATSKSGVTVYRDHYGVAHVEAANLQGLAYATGYLTARDRLFEMDVIRKLGQGRLSELIGPSMLASDRYTRREFLLSADIEGQYQALSPQEKSLYGAYADGVNKGALETLANPATTPALFVALGDPWEPWRPEDSVIVDMVFTEVTFGGEGAAGELDNTGLLASLQRQYGKTDGLARFNDLFPPTTPEAPSVIAPNEGTPVPGHAGYDVSGPTPGQQSLIDLPRLTTAVAAQTQELATVRSVLAAAHIPVPHVGSYAAALGGTRTASHGGLLLGSPQSGLESPPIFYEIGWHIPGALNCEGFTVPGLGPAIGVGWCNQHAWTLVAGNIGDQADLYVEKLDPANPHRYFFRGAWHNTVRRSTTYIVKSPVGCPVQGVPAPCAPQVITETYDYTVHGPIGEVDQADHLGLAYRRAQTGVFLRSLTGSAGFDLSTGRAGFMDAADTFTASYNMIYVDNQGHIDYRFTGLQPVRPGTDRRFPMPGTGEAEWQGFLSQSAMPHVDDPTSGYIAVNQGTESKPIDWWPNSSGVSVGAVSRVGRDQQLLAPLQHATSATLASVNKQYLQEADPYAALFAALFDRALSASSDPRLRAADAQLRAWRSDGYARTDGNNDGLEDHPGLAIFELDPINYAPPTAGFQVPLGKELIADVLAPLTGGRLFGTYQAQLSAVYRVLTGRTSRPYLADVDQVVRTVVARLVAQLTRQYGTANMAAWHQTFPSEPFTAIGLVGPAPVKGMDHGSYSQIVDPAAGTGENVEPPGNVAADSLLATVEIGAGHPPAHFQDQRQLYENYQFKPMLLQPSQYRSKPEAVITLDDGGKYGNDTTIDYRSGRDPCRRS